MTFLGVSINLANRAGDDPARHFSVAAAPRAREIGVEHLAAPIHKTTVIPKWHLRGTGGF